MDSSGGRQEPSRPLTAEEEALKWNTDCVYFLASPLTCKKGSECEYRHSEGARFNPWDCWYWLKGNCLNPKCCFRHPPLDWLFRDPGVMAMPAEPPSSSGLPTTVQAAHPSAHNTNKQNVPCYFFLKGHCLKGDMCPFMHGQQPTGASVPQQVTMISAPSSDFTPALTKDKWVPKECTHQESTPRTTAAKAVAMLPSPAKYVIQAENVPNNGFVVEHSASHYSFEDDFPRLESTIFPLSQSRSHQFQSIDEHLQNGKEADEFLGESSPGFDVIVDDHMDGSDYFQNEGGSTLNFETDFSYHHSDYESVPRLETDQYNEIREYDVYRRSLCDREQHRTSFERILDRSSMLDKRKLWEDNYDELDRSDLRHRLLKLRRLNGSRSDRHPEHHGNHSWRDNQYIHENRSHAWHSERDHWPLPRERSRSSRLKSRIALPTRSSPDRYTGLRSEIDTDRERYQTRSVQARLMNNQGKCNERIKRRLHEDLSSSARISGGQTFFKDDPDPLGFAGPKSLADLKGAKVAESSQEQERLSSRKAVDHEESGTSLSFEGPKPLSVIIKIKREIAPGSSAISSAGDRNNQRNADGYVHNPASVVFSDSQYQRSIKAENGGNILELSKVTKVKEKEEGMITIKRKELLNGNQSLAKGNIHEAENEMTANGMDDNEQDDYGLRDGESEFETADGGENVYQEDEEGEDDDFAKKAAVMLS